MIRVHVQYDPLVAKTHTVVLDETAPIDGYSEILVISVPRRSDLSRLAETIYEMVPAPARRVARLLVLRAHPQEAAGLTILHSQPAADLLSRFQRLDIAVLHLAMGSHALTRLKPSSPFQPADITALVRAVRIAELEALAIQSGSLLPANRGFHYIGPNRFHYRAFLRVATALQMPDALDAACFWVSPHVPPESVVLVDSPTLLAVGLGIAQYQRDRGVGVHQVQGVDVLKEQTDEAQAQLVARLLTLRGEMPGIRSALCVCSVLSSGTTLTRLEVAAHKVGLAPARVAIYATEGALDDPATVVLGRTPRDVARLTPCPLCDAASRERSSTIRISPVSLHMEVAGAVSRRTLKRTTAKPAREFLERYAGAGIITAHQTERDGHTRHHTVSVNPEPLLDHPQFKAKFDAKVDALGGRVDTILAPEHRAARLIASRVGERLGIEPIHCDENHIDELPPSQRAIIYASQSLLIVDDVIISGDRLRGYRQFLLEAGRDGGDVHVLIAVSRPSSMDEAQAVRNLADQMAMDESSFHPIEELLLPNWGREACPWCWELERLSAYRGLPDSWELSEAVLQRQAVLTQVDIGLVDDLFWTDGTTLPLGEGSIFGPTTLTQAELFAAVASSMQYMRSAGELDEEFLPPAAKILTSEFWASGRYYAPAITAAILRAAKAHDLTPPQPSAKLLRDLRARLAEPAAHGIRNEFVLAIAQNKLPWCIEAEEALTDPSDDPVTQNFLLGLLHDDGRLEGSEGANDAS